MPSSAPDYAELHCCSTFNFLKGASMPEELVERAATLGYSALAITDECSMAGVVRAHAEAKKTGLHLLIGSEFVLEDGLRLVGLAMNREGYGNLCELITLARQRSAKGTYRITRADFESCTDAPHLARLPDCLILLIPRRNQADGSWVEDMRWVRSLFPGRGWISVERLLHAGEEVWFERIRHAAETIGMPLVAAGDVHMHDRAHKPLQDTMTAIRLSQPLAACGYALQPNAEQHLRTRLELAQLYPPELLQETLSIAARCTFSLDELRYEYPDELTGTDETYTDYLRRMVENGMRWRFPKGASIKVRKQIEHELKLIADLKYEPYFLTVFDIVSFARSQGILCQGRGSAANSAVCYCLGITEIDPERSNLLFERFISRERNEPPDIDVDFEHQRRGEVIQYIYRRYGRDRAAIAATVITYRTRSAVQDVGKALGLDIERIRRLSTSLARWDKSSDINKRLGENGFDPGSPVIRQLILLTTLLYGYPRHLSQHVGGFVLTRDKLCRIVPIENAAMPNRRIIQWDKDDLAEVGLMKVDVLALGMLSAIHRALDLISSRRGVPFQMQDIPPEDEKTYDMICKADTIGVFQIESRAQMSMLPRLRPRTFYDLVVEVAIVRPGPIQGDMVHPYLRRRQDKEKPDYPEGVETALARTYGVPIFQEQVMQVAMLAAGFTSGEADQLRRSMAAWKRKGGLGAFHEKLIDGMTNRGYTREFAERIFRQIEGFGEYGFPESHAASFALLVYVSAWLKCHEPAAFLCALLNSLPMGFYSASQLIQDAGRHGVQIKPVDVTISNWECILEEQEDKALQPIVRLGLNRVKGMGLEAATRIVEAREIASFENPDDLANRASLNTAEVHALARADALRTLSGHRRQTLWSVASHITQRDLMRHAPAKETLPVIPAAPEGEEIIADYASTRLTLRRHPLALLRPTLASMNLRSAMELSDYPTGRLVRTTGIVTCRQRPGTASGVMFVTLEDETGITNVVLWNQVILKYRRETLNSKLLTVYGVWQSESGVKHLIAKRLVDHSHLLGSLVVESRDFH
ncbi:error-prone DNA polymerase, DnaE-like [Nitrosospira multiformis ATCC 25196]|uniref:Error-prone DNA polymerase n=1 Tax=Nitrosospira multiformis (strain ATCC 25196 / NCIMB 11849 / C 71) TaxID=323848 RepID=Q2Y5T5_NITMU|nr:error-prone DNA polymerase [Nitrosospira multiformis]ABB75886.1 error-prone DNA polymerase, DnaE-like protein [Nitrosospira multiformis ATCC 25196]SEF64032.1 error-prone DNA polymerase, DnaE-like [Nitrosospira multiformis ATCC 25196]